MPQTFHPLNERYVGEVFNARTQSALIDLIWARDGKYTLFQHRAWQKEHRMTGGTIVWPQIASKPMPLDGHSNNYKYQPVQKLIVGTMYFAPNVLMRNQIHQGFWEDTVQQHDWRDLGLIYRDPSAAAKMLRKLLETAENEA